MSDDQFSIRFNSQDGQDPFAPETIDEQITARIANTAPTDRESHLIQGLATLNKLPPGAEDSLARVRMRVRLAPFPEPATMRATEGNRPMISHQTPPSRRAPSSPSDVSSRGDPHIRRTIQTFVAVAAVVLLIAGFYTLIQQRSGGPGVHPTATATSPAQSTAQATATSTSTAPLASAAQVTACGFSAYSAYSPVYDLGNGLIVIPDTSMAFPAFQLPEGTPLKPFKVDTDTNSSLLQSPLVNPDLRGAGIYLVACNIGQQPITIQGVKVSIISFTPYSGQLNSWNRCDGMYAGPNKIVGGCGGGQVSDEVVVATFAANAGVGTVVDATQKSAEATYGPMPFALPVHQSAQRDSGVVRIRIPLAPPTAQGTYTFGLGLVAQQNTTAFFPASKPMLLAPVTQKWDGPSCQAPNMASQIPPETNPPTYYICPQPK